MPDTTRALAHHLKFEPDTNEEKYEMAELKTTPNDRSVENFLNEIEPGQKRKDGFRLLEIMKKLTNSQPQMWGESIIGFGTYHYKYASGREGDWFVTGFSPRKQNLSIYLMSCENDKRLADLYKKLGKHKTGKACLYVKKLEDIDESVLTEMIKESIQSMKEKYPDMTI
ncbi:DUF1801 domain-containing protein [Sunxiuqinia indica]|uniref:DUF1801 domain-containing protein n=1 Tax=Sunxiuqinia indica TaxID=2692584 RepID=UPI0019158CD7|nr:DUF1801 domain-containing protein [Sunxiuqinia indica]